MPSFDKFNLEKPIKRNYTKVPKLTKKQQEVIKSKAYNAQFNELFKLHKFLVECKYTEHSVGQGNPVDDAIKLIKELIQEKEG